MRVICWQLEFVINYWFCLFVCFEGSSRDIAQWLRALIPRAGLGSQHPHRSSQLSATPAPGDLTSSNGNTCRQNTNVPKINMNNVL